MLILKLNVASSGAWASARSKKEQKRSTNAHEGNEMEIVTSLTNFFMGASDHRMQHSSCSMVLKIIRSKTSKTSEKAYAKQARKRKRQRMSNKSYPLSLCTMRL